MEAPAGDIPDWLREAHAIGPYPDLLRQLEKDYGRANLEFFLPQEGEPETILPGQLLQGLRESIYLLLMERFDQYLNLMYAADVPEREFRSVSAADPVEAAAQVAEILLRREWQKVSLRNRSGASPD